MPTGFGPGLAKSSQLSGAVTTITSLLATDIVIGEDAQTKIDFETADEIHFDANNAEIVKIDSTGLNIVAGSLETATIDYTDGDLAITIADGGGVTFTQIDDAHLDSSPGNNTVSGVTATFTAGEALQAGECVYYKASDSKMHKAVAAAGSVTPPCIALAAENLSADASGKFLLVGFIRNDDDFPTYTAGDEVYTPEAETSSQNVPEATAPDSDGDLVQVLGIAIDGNTLYFNPSLDVIEHA